MLYILNRDMEVVTVANNIGTALPYFEDLHSQNLEAGTSSYEFTIPTNHPDADKVVEGNYVVRTDLDGNHLMFTIMHMEETHADDKLKVVYCEDAGLELLNEVQGTYKETTAKNIQYYINKSIVDAGWEIGYCDVTATRTLEFTEYENSLARILKIASEFDGVEISFSVKMSGSKVSHRYVNIYNQRGVSSGKRFTYSKDITSITRKVNMDEVCTAMIGIGKTDDKGVTTLFTNLTYDDGDIYTVSGNNFVFSRSAVDRWGQQGGNINSIFQYDTTDAQELLNRTLTEFKKRLNPSVTYEVEVALLERLAGYKEEKVRIGDTVKVVDTSFNPPLYLEARIVALETSYVDPSKDKATLGNYKVVKSNISAQLLAMQSKLMQKEATWDTVVDALGVANDAKSSIDGLVVGARNLVVNSTFRNDLNDWSLKTIFDVLAPEVDKPFSNILTLTYTGQASDVNRQTWCDAIQIDADGTKEFTVSFDIRTPSLASIDSGKMAFCIRTFNDATKTANADSSWAKNIYVTDMTLIDNAWTRYTITVKPTGGKYIKVAPYMTRNGTLNWREIQLEAGNKATSWQPAVEDVNGSIDGLSDTVGVIDGRTTDIVGTVVYSESFTSILSDKANAEDISDMATGEMLTESAGNTIKYIDGRIDGAGGVNEAINAVSSELTKTANSINAKFSSSGGINLIKNSIGYVGTDFWTISGTMNTLQNQELEQLGFGSGWYLKSGTTGYIEQKVSTHAGDTYSLSFWMKKTVGNATNGDAGVEVWENGVKKAFVGKTGTTLSSGYELGVYTFTTAYSEITIRVTIGANAEATISGLMLNVGQDAYQWQHANGEVYNTNVQMNLNGIKVINTATSGYTIMSPQEFSGYALVEGSMQRVFTLNGDTTEVTKIDIDKEINMSPIKVIPIVSTSYNGWAWIPS
jgi:phage minor structural protein